jgi:glutaredoxin 2
MAEIKTKNGAIQVSFGFRILAAIAAESQTSLTQMGEKLDAFDFSFIEIVTKHVTGYEGEKLHALLDEPGIFKNIRNVFMIELVNWMAVADYAEELAEKKE